MNDLSFWLYMIQLLNALYIFSWLMGTLGVITTIFAMILMATERDAWERWKADPNKKENPWEEYYLKDYMKVRSIFRVSLPASIILVLTGIILPDIKTMHMMLASEAGEFVINTEAGQLAYEALISTLKGYAQ